MVRFESPHYPKVVCGLSVKLGQKHLKAIATCASKLLNVPNSHTIIFYEVYPGEDPKNEENTLKTLAYICSYGDIGVYDISIYIKTIKELYGEDWKLKLVHTIAHELAHIKIRGHPKEHKELTQTLFDYLLPFFKSWAGVKI